MTKTYRNEVTRVSTRPKSVRAAIEAFQQEAGSALRPTAWESGAAAFCEIYPRLGTSVFGSIRALDTGDDGLTPLVITAEVTGPTPLHVEAVARITQLQKKINFASRSILVRALVINRDVIRAERAAAEPVAAGPEIVAGGP